MERKRRFETQAAAGPVQVSAEKAKALRLLLESGAECDCETIVLWALAMRAGERPPIDPSGPRARLAAALASVPDAKLWSMTALIGAALPLCAVDISMLAAEVVCGRAPAVDFTMAMKKLEE